jgi:hypothetical protein
MLWLLDGATQLKDTTAAHDRLRPWRGSWQRQAISEERFIGGLETIMK